MVMVLHSVIGCAGPYKDWIQSKHIIHLVSGSVPYVHLRVVQVAGTQSWRTAFSQELKKIAILPRSMSTRT